MQEGGTIQWFPGHMARTRRKIKESLGLVDATVEIIDARIPVSSRNPELDGLVGEKPRLIVLNKADLADEAATRAWVAFLRTAGAAAMGADCKSGRGMERFSPLLKELLADKLAAWESKGMGSRPIRVMVLGIPNVGKSSFINRMIRGGAAGKAEVQDRPGVTRQNRWFTVGKGFELLDTPGVLWPKFEDPIVGQHLAFTGAVRDEVLDIEGLAASLLELLLELYPNAINTRYKTDISPEDHLPGHELLERVGRKRGMLISGGEVNTERAAITVLDEYRGGKLGRITLERP